MAHICCSIELEPKTLNEGRLNNVREAAVQMVQKLESNEASNITNERPIVLVKGMEQMVERRDEHMQVELKRAQVTEISCQCSCTFTNILDESPDNKLREPLSAPF